jgi:hypothetical protein
MKFGHEVLFSAGRIVIQTIGNNQPRNIIENNIEGLQVGFRSQKPKHPIENA